MDAPSDWVDYWNSENFFDHFDWKEFDEFFVNATEPIMNYTSEDIVLDIGCGEGYLEALLKERVREIHGVDTSDRYIHACKEKFKNEQNVFFHKLDRKDYTNFSFLEKKFSKIICLSVIQYYKSVKDVEKLIRGVEKVALPGAKFIIADIITHSSLISDIRSYVKGALKRKAFIKASLSMILNRKSNYYKFYSSVGLLVLPVEEMHNLVETLDLNAFVLDEPLTACENRKHMLIMF